MIIEKILLIFMAIGFILFYSPEEKAIKSICKARWDTLRVRFTEDEYLSRLRGDTRIERLIIHVGKLLQAAFFMGSRVGIISFFTLSLIIGTFVFLLSIKVMPLWITLGAFFMALLLPYILLLGQVQLKRINSSLEGEILVTELFNNYKINYCNMREAIEVTALTIEGAPNSKKLLFNLAKGLNKSLTGAELKKITEEFRFAIGTSWAGILSTNIFLSCHSGMKVTESLSDLAESMRKARTVEEFSQRENNEAFLILKYLVPMAFMLMMVGGMKLFDMSLSRFVEFQFGTRSGFTWFMLWILSYIFAIGINIVFTKRKFDL